MPVYHIRDEEPFPATRLAEPDGLLAYGADVSVERLLMAYPMGIFPWYNEGQPPLWWAPHDRCVLYPELMHCSKSLKQVIRQKKYDVRMDTAFDQVVQACGYVGASREHGTWINPDLKASLSKLHELGWAHSVEAWMDGELVGGLYGVSIGAMFFGESMFASSPDASKVALYHLCQYMIAEGMELIDCQLPNDHLFSLGAQMMSRDEFYPQLEESVNKMSHKGSWKYSSS